MPYEVVSASATREFVVTPSDVTLVTCRALWIGTGGTVVVSRKGATAVTYSGVPAGAPFPVRLDGDRVMAATTAGSIVGMDW